MNLLLNLITTWVRSWNAYEPNQWTLLPLLKGAFLVYTMLFATAYMKPRYRMMVEMALFVYYYISNDRAFPSPYLVARYTNSNTAEYGTQFFFGAFLCDLSQFPPYIDWIAARKWPGRVLAPILIFIGLLLASYPETKPELMPWSNFMLKMAGWIFPPNHPDTPRFYSGIGLEFLALGMHFSDHVKAVLSNKYLLWAGKNSFAVYLLHGTLLRTILVWMLYGIAAPPDIIQEDGTHTAAPHLKLGGRLQWYFWLPIWFVIQYWIANLWMKYVDPLCARITQNLEEYVFEEQNAVEKSILP